MDLFALTPLRRQLIAEANHFINWLFGSIAAALAPGIARTLPGMKAVFRDYLLPAEAALRRALHILAADLPVPTMKPSQGNRRAIFDPSNPREGAGICGYDSSKESAAPIPAGTYPRRRWPLPNGCPPR
jgi:hypothetical protein